MSLLSRLAEKSWQTPGSRGFAEPEDYRPAAAAVALYIYFAVAAALFSLLAAAYVMRMGSGMMDHGMGGSDWRQMPEPPLLWINTCILLASSVVWEAARRSARSGSRERLRTTVVAGAVLSLVFLAGQFLLWRQYQAAGYYLSANPANAFFYLLTTVHGLHLAGGLVACARTVGQLDAQDADERAMRNVRLCAIYWHFLLLIWVLVAGLLVAT